MKAVILAGGMGTRISEETGVRPKPMVEVGARPLLWHIMKIYAHHGITDFVVCLGYRGHVIKEYFAGYHLRMGDVTFDLAENRMEVHRSDAEPWRVTLVETGDATMTGGRVRRVLDHVGAEPFCLTYGDGLADVDLTALLRFHREQGALATLTAVRPPGRWGALEVAGQRVSGFHEKPRESAWVNGGFFVLDPRVGEYIDGDETVWEEGPLERLAAARQLAPFFHHGFFQPVDTLRDRRLLEQLWASDRAPWKVW